jgi:hypothetical protein
VALNCFVGGPEIQSDAREGRRRSATLNSGSVHVGGFMVKKRGKTDINEVLSSQTFPVIDYE